MLDWLEIRHFAIAEGVELEFNDGFTVVTGETGSGKSIIIDALGILLGHRSDHTYIRHDQDSAELQAGFILEPDHNALHWLGQNGFDNDGECILRRVLRRDKPGRGYINGHAATVTQLRELGRTLVDIHGQNEHHSLLKRANQLVLLDAAAGIAHKTEQLSTFYEVIQEVHQQIEKLDRESQATQERADLLRFQIEELTELAPGRNEWEELEKLQKRLGNQQELASGCQQVSNLLCGEESDSIVSLLVRSNQQLRQIERFDDTLKEAADMLEEARIIVEEANTRLQPWFESQQLDAGEIQRIESRFSRFHALARKHRIPPSELAEHLDSMQAELDRLKDPAGELSRLEGILETATGKWMGLAEKIGKARNKHAARLSSEVTSLMQDLGMKGGEFKVSLIPEQEGAVTRYGNEAVEFLVTANPGQPVRSLSKVASGGEVSRISLAIQVVLANKADVTTLVFDEVDVGIGGEIANVVGARLKDLGNSRQVLCITHLSQVAARGDHHFSVSKSIGKDLQVKVQELDTDQRIEEIARMTTGEKVTSQSLAHAEEMIKSG